MKQSFSILALLAAITFAASSLVSCNDESDEQVSPISSETKQSDSESESDSTIVGKWLLSQVDYHFGGVKDWSENGAEYLFQNDSILSVKDESREDGNGIFLKSGEYQYSFDEKTGRIIIDNSTYWYRLKEDELIIDTGSAWDAPVFTFKRIKQK